MPLGCCEDSYYFLVGGVRVAAKTRQEGTGFKDEENTINP